MIIRMVQELLGGKDLRTTAVCTRSPTVPAVGTFGAPPMRAESPLRLVRADLGSAFCSLSPHRRADRRPLELRLPFSIGLSN
jgi:hypothetical protein